ncbi:hypothetical protein AB1Y20_018333 [Prymnesium parvum]|uniref:Protein misato homolog 1 n=1 Tax=Prymnesium parvum TaxID=97485 RepID=A0AB34JRL2_PRYPA
MCSPAAPRPEELGIAPPAFGAQPSPASLARARAPSLRSSRPSCSPLPLPRQLRPAKREIITFQLGPFANYVGTHFWNVQEEAAAQDPESNEDAPDEPERQAAERRVLYQPRADDHGHYASPRLIACDFERHFGSLGTSGRYGSRYAGAEAAPIDPLSWGGDVTQVVHEAREVHRFTQMMSAPVLAAWDTPPNEAEAEGGEEEGEGEERAERRPEEGDEKEAQGGGEGEEEVKQASFNFDESVKAWSDFLQARLHPSAIAPLKPHVHGFSTLARFPDGACVVEREDDLAASGNPELFDRCRRSLEVCDSLQGFHLLVDADSGFGGMGAALLTRIRDDYSRAPCLALGMGVCTRAAPPEEATVEAERDAHSYVDALNDAFALTAFAELRTSYLPVYGSSTIRAVSDRRSSSDAQFMCTAPPLLAIKRALPYHTAAPLALMLDCATLPYRANVPTGSLHSLTSALAARSEHYLAAAALAVPLPPDGASLSLKQAHQFDWFQPLAPLQLAPRAHAAHEQAVSWLGLPGGGRQAAATVRSLLPSRGSGGVLWTRPQHLVLPLSFPQFFSNAVGRDGSVLAAPGYDARPPTQPRPPSVEVMKVPCATALQSTGALLPLIERVRSDWRSKRLEVGRAANTEGWAQVDDLNEITEQLDSLHEAYTAIDEGLGNWAEPEDDDGSDD